LVSAASAAQLFRLNNFRKTGVKFLRARRRTAYMRLRRPGHAACRCRPLKPPLVVDTVDEIEALLACSPAPYLHL
jgi:hypothetical protein